MPPPSSPPVGTRIVDLRLARHSSTRGSVRAAEDVLRGLRARLGQWIGRDAFDALMARALAEVGSRHVALAAARWRPDDARLAGMEGSTADPEALQVAFAALLDALLAHLGRFIGEDIAAWLMLEEADTPGPSGRGEP